MSLLISLFVIFSPLIFIVSGLRYIETKQFINPKRPRFTLTGELAETVGRAYVAGGFVMSAAGLLAVIDFKASVFWMILWGGTFLVIGFLPSVLLERDRQKHQ